MNQQTTNTQILYPKIVNIVEKLLQEIEFTKPLNKNELFQKIYQILKQNLAEANLNAINAEDLETKIKNILFIEILSSFLKDLSLEELETFESVVKEH